MSIIRLDQIVESKRREMEGWGDVTDLDPRAWAARPPRDFALALRRSPIRLIAEIKPRCPVRGEFPAAQNPIRLARMYQSAGASAISVLADGIFFGGGPDLVRLVANHSDLRLPILYKDFVIDPRQIYTARACGADALLLIVRAVEPVWLPRLIALTHDLGMEALVETSNENEISRALTAGAKVIGINNRDPDTQLVNLRRSAELVRAIPEHLLRISESGINSRTDMLMMAEAGFNAVLVGEALLSSTNPAERVTELLGTKGQLSEGKD